MQKKLKRPILIGLLLATVPFPAYCFPFIMAGGGFALLPFLLAALSAFNKNKIWIVAATLFSLVCYQLWTPSFQEISGVQEKDDNRLSYMMSNEQLTQSRVVGANTQKLAMSYDQAVKTGRKLMFVNPGGNANFPGMSFIELATNSQYLDKSSILISSDKYVSANAARISGLNYVSESINDVIADTPAISPNTASISCKAINCTNVAVLDGYYFLYSGYPYKRFADTITMDSLLVSPNKGIDKIKTLSANGKNPLYIEYFSSDERPEFQKGLNSLLLRDGVTNFQIGHYEEVDKTPDNFGILAKNFFITNNIIEFDEVGFLCKNNTDLVMASNNAAEKQILLTNYVLKKCNIHTIPVQGMTAHDAERYIQNHIAEFPNNRRYLGVYSDKVSAFYIGIALDTLKEEARSAIGKSPISVDAEPEYGPNDMFDPKQIMDTLTMKVFKPIFGLDKEMSESTFTTIAIIISLTIFSLFITCQKPIVFQSAWVINMCYLGYSQLIFFYYPIEQTFDPFNTVITIVSIQLLLTILYSRLYKKETFTKEAGLKWLSNNRLRTIPYITINQLDESIIDQVTDELGFPIIFRSNEKSVENNGHQSSGLFDSLIFEKAVDFHDLAVAWKKMQDLGGSPSFLAQPYLKFEMSGVAQYSHTATGASVITIEHSQVPEAVTGNKPGAIEHQTIDPEACFFSDNLIHHDLYKIYDNIKSTFTAEFGVSEGKVYWNQILKTRSHSSFLSENSHGYSLSGFNEEMDTPTPLLVSMLNRYLPWMSYKIIEGKVHEKRSAIFPIVDLISKLMPEKLMFQISQRIHLNFNFSRLTNRSLDATIFTLLTLDLVSKLKKPTNTLIEYKINKSELIVANLKGSPYSSTAIMDTTEHSDELTTMKGRVNFACADICRVTLSKLLGNKIVKASLAIKKAGITESLVQYADWKNLKRGIYSSESFFAPSSNSDETLSFGYKNISEESLSISSEDEVSSLKLALQGKTGITINAEYPWLSLLTYSENIGAINIKQNVSTNSHFVQRAKAAGITIKKQK
jgi:hypothetical protein